MVFEVVEVVGLGMNEGLIEAQLKMKQNKKLNRWGSDFSGRNTATPGETSPGFTRNKRRSNSVVEIGNLKTLIKPSQKLLQAHNQTEIAAEVVIQYLLPMFEQKPNLQSSKYNQFSAQLNPVPNTVYGELKQVENLYAAWESAKKDCVWAKQKLKDSEQLQQSIKKELQHLKSLQAGNLEKIEKIKNEQNDCIAQEQYIELDQDAKFSLSKTKLDLQELLESTQQKYISSLSEEKLKNDKLRLTTSQLNHSNNILFSQNDIMAEKLEGLYQHLGQILTRKSIETKMVYEAANVANWIENVALQTQDLKYDLADVIITKQEHDQVYEECQEMCEETTKAKQKLRQKIQSQMETLGRERDDLADRRNYLVERLVSKNSQCKSLTDLQEKLRQKVKKYRHLFQDQEEKVCKNCNQYYTERENYNWVCRTHSTHVYGGDMWWCCGKIGENAIGCISSKHVPKEEAEDEDEKAHMNKQIQSKTKCFSCKGIGHRTENCPKDPNIRSVSYLETEDELKRIRAIDIRKSNTHIGYLETMNMVLDRDMTGGKMQGFSIDGESLDSDIYDKENMFFEDVKELRNNLTFDADENLIEIEEIFTRELNRELQSFTSYRLSETSPMLRLSDTDLKPRQGRAVMRRPTGIFKEPPLDTDTDDFKTQRSLSPRFTPPGIKIFPARTFRSPVNSPGVSLISDESQDEIDPSYYYK